MRVTRTSTLSLIAGVLLCSAATARAQTTTAVALSADGKVRASVGEGSVLHVQDATTGKELRQFTCPDADLVRLALAPDGGVVAAADQNGTVYLWETATGKDLHRFLTGDGAIAALVFSPSGKMLAVAANDVQDVLSLWTDGTLCAWEVATGSSIGRLRAASRPIWSMEFTHDGRALTCKSAQGTLTWEPATGHQEWQPGEGAARRDSTSVPAARTPFILVGRALSSPTEPMGDEKLAALWVLLADPDAAKAYQAVGSLTAAAGPAEPFLAAHLQPIPADVSQRADTLVRELDDKKWAVRDRAEAELQALGELAEPQLRKVVQKPPSLEVSRRAEWLLERLESRQPSADALRRQRAVEVLEQLGTTEARQVLQTLADGAPNARLTRDARHALNRLTRQP